MPRAAGALGPRRDRPHRATPYAKQPPGKPQRRADDLDVWQSSTSGDGEGLVNKLSGYIAAWGSAVSQFLTVTGPRALESSGFRSPPEKSYTSRLEQGNAFHNDTNTSMFAPQLAPHFLGQTPEKTKKLRPERRRMQANPKTFETKSTQPQEAVGIGANDAPAKLELRLSPHPDVKAEAKRQKSDHVPSTRSTRAPSVTSVRSFETSSTTLGGLLPPGRHSSAAILSAWRQHQRLRADQARSRQMQSLLERENNAVGHRKHTNDPDLWQSPLRFMPQSGPQDAKLISEAEAPLKEIQKRRNLQRSSRQLRRGQKLAPSDHVQRPEEPSFIADGSEPTSRTVDDGELEAQRPVTAAPKNRKSSRRRSLEQRQEQQPPPQDGGLTTSYSHRRPQTRESQVQTDFERPLGPTVDLSSQAKTDGVKRPHVSDDLQQTPKPTPHSLKAFFEANEVSTIPKERRKRPGCFSAWDEDLDMIDDENEGPGNEVTVPPKRVKLDQDSTTVETPSRKAEPSSESHHYNYFKPRTPLLQENDEILNFKTQRQAELQNSELALAKSDELQRNAPEKTAIDQNEHQRKDGTSIGTTGFENGISAITGASQAQPERLADSGAGAEAPKFSFGVQANNVKPEQDTKESRPVQNDNAFVANDAPESGKDEGSKPAQQQFFSFQSKPAESAKRGREDAPEDSNKQPGGFTFGTSNAETKPSPFSFTQTSSTPTFSFQRPAEQLAGAERESSKGEAGPPLSFGAQNDEASKQSPFSFGQSPQKQATESGASSLLGNDSQNQTSGANNADMANEAKPSPFTFSNADQQKTDTQQGQQAKSSSPFNFGRPSSDTATGATQFSFGAPKNQGQQQPEQNKAKESSPFTFSQSAPQNEEKRTEPAKPAPSAFSFNQSETKTDSQNTSTLNFSFGQQDSAKQDQQANNSTPNFSFGVPNQDKSQSPAPLQNNSAFSFGQNAQSSSGQSAFGGGPSLTFGATEQKQSTNDGSDAGKQSQPFQFGQGNKQNESDSPKPFSFGASQANGPSSSFTFNSSANSLSGNNEKSNAPSFGIPSQSNDKQSAFSFGQNQGTSSAQPSQPSFSFNFNAGGQGQAQNSPMANSPFGASPMPTSAVPAFNAGSGSGNAFGGQANSAFGSQSPAAPFGSNNAPPSAQPDPNNPFQFNAGASSTTASPSGPMSGRKIAPMRRRRAGGR